jgi:hypothetical protein
MLTREISYTDFNDEKVVEKFYFNISKPELVEMEVEYKEGLGQKIQNIIDAKDYKQLIRMFKEIILVSYGQKSEDGRRFIKNDTLREEFVQTAAYHVLFMELAADATKAAEFLKGVLPKDMTGDIDKAVAEIQANTLQTETKE